MCKLLVYLFLKTYLFKHFMPLLDNPTIVSMQLNKILEQNWIVSCKIFINELDEEEHSEVPSLHLNHMWHC